MPWECEHVWQWFWEIRDGIGGNGFGPNPMSNVEVRAWRENTHTEPSPWELCALRTMDNTFMNFYAERQERKKTKSATDARARQRRLKR